MPTRDHRSFLGRILAFLAAPFPTKSQRVHFYYQRVKAALFYRQIFAEFGSGSVLFKPTLISGAKFIHIGRNAFIRSGARLEAAAVDPRHPPQLRIGNGVAIEQDVQIGCVGVVRIGDNTAIGPRCAIIGGYHPFYDVKSEVPIKDRFGGARSVTEIGEGCLIGMGTVVKMNVKIGRHVVVGPNAVVASNLPDYCLAEGNPAVVVLKYDPVTDRWERPQSTST